MKNSKLYELTPEELQILLNESDSYSDLLRKLNMNPHGGNPKTLQSIIHKYNLDESILDRNRKNLYKKNAYKTHKKIIINTEDIIFNNKHPNYQTSKLLKRLINEGYKDNKCEICGISEWNNKKLQMQLHHIDGNNTNNSLDNLQVLCPNCHSQTDNYCGKSKDKNNNKNKHFIKNEIKKNK